MADHRVRLNDREVDLVCAALRARIAGLKSEHGRREVQQLLVRLEEGLPGNPVWRLGLLTETE